MALDERARHELFLRLEQVLGAQEADTLMELLPPVGWTHVATKRDLDALDERLGLRFELVDQRFQLVDQRFEAMEHRLDQAFEALDQRFESLQPHFEAVENKLLAAFRGELSSAIGSQTKTLVLTHVAAIVTVAAVALGTGR